MMKLANTKTAMLIGAGLLALSSAAARADDQSCHTVSLADPSWSDIAVTNATAGLLLEGMGYEAKPTALAVPIIFGGLKDSKIDVFLGNWMPAQQGYYDKFVTPGAVSLLTKNLDGIEYTLAVPDYVWDAGVHNFADLNKFADKFDGKMYGIAAGSPGNQHLEDIIKKNDFQLGKWKVVSSSEQAMLAEVDRAVKAKRFITFLGWAPHPMNVKLKMHYLKGGETYFGETGTVNTLTRNGYAAACPNVAKLLTNLTFTMEMENTIMGNVVDNKVSNADAVKSYLKAHPELLDKWLAGVKTEAGAEALPAVKAKL